MKICIIGGSGVIGSKLVQWFIKNNADVYFTYYHNKIFQLKNGIKLDITDKSSIQLFLNKLNPDVVIHTAALANVDLCETDKFLADRINIEGTKNVIDGCKISNCKLVYVSTSFVFDGAKKEYFEDDETCPTTYYGHTKLEGEKLVMNSDLPYLILRTDQPYCWIESGQHTNSVLRVIETLQSEKVLREITNWYNNPTYVPDFVYAVSNLLLNKLTGIFHIVGPDFVDRYNWSLISAKIFDLNTDLIEPINSDKLELPAKRVNVNLNNQKLLDTTGVKMKGIKEGLLSMLKEKQFKNL